MNSTENKQERMKNIKVLGIGSSRYKQLTHNLFTVINELDIEAEIEQYEEIDDFLRFNIVEIPTLMIDGKIVSRGRVPDIEELRFFLVPNTVY
ncbi:MAG: thioredoxin family protein [Saprospiraceae bacterium]